MRQPGHMTAGARTLAAGVAATAAAGARTRHAAAAVGTAGGGRSRHAVVALLVVARVLGTMPWVLVNMQHSATMV
jgi:hypothetical protein